MGARRGLVVLEPGDGLGPDTTIGLGLARSDLGHIETVPRGEMSYGQLLDGPVGAPGGEGGEIVHPDLFAEDALDPRHREVAVRLGYAASYALPLATDAATAWRRRVAVRRARRTDRAAAPSRRPVRPVRHRASGPGPRSRAHACVHDDHRRGAAAVPAPPRGRRAARRAAPHGSARRRRLVRRAAAARCRARPRGRLGDRLRAERDRRDGLLPARPCGRTR